MPSESVNPCSAGHADGYRCGDNAGHTGPHGAAVGRHFVVWGSRCSGPVRTFVQLQKMISAAAEMKTEIKRFVDRWANAYSATIPESPRVPWRRVRPLVDAMEGWVNASLTEEEKRNEREM